MAEQKQRNTRRERRSFQLVLSTNSPLIYQSIMVLLDHHYQITQLPTDTAVPHMLNADF